MILLAIILIGSIVFYMKRGESVEPISLYERGNVGVAISGDQEREITIEEPNASVLEEEQAMDDSSPDNELTAASELSIPATDSEEELVSDQDELVSDQDELVSDHEELVIDQEELFNDQEEFVNDQEEFVNEQEETVNDQDEIVVEQEEYQEPVIELEEYQEPVNDQDDPQDQPDSDTDQFDATDMPAFHAIQTNDMVLLEQLILRDVNISATIGDSAASSDLIGFNAFHYAAYKLNTDAMSLLLQDRAGFGVDDFTTGMNTMPALHIVAWRGTKHPEKSLAAAEFLLSRSAAINSVGSDLKTPAFIATETSNLALLNLFMIWNFDATYTVPIANYNILHVAMAPCHRPIIKALMTYAPPGIVNDVNMFNRMPIHEAAANNCVDGLKELILSHRISKQTLSPPSSERKFRCDSSDALFSASPLHFAAKFKNFEAAEFLLLIQANFNSTDEYNLIAREYAGSDGVPLYDYFNGRKEWERTHKSDGQAEDKLRFMETQSPEYLMENYMQLRGECLHQKSLINY